jgi:hypothetical protein
MPIVLDGTTGVTSPNLGVGVPLSAWNSSTKVVENESGALFSIGTNSLRLYQNAYYNSAGNNTYENTGNASAYIQTSGQHQFFSAPSGTAGNNATFTAVLAVEKDKSLSLQGATPQTGAGITFPATQSASTDANTLDDYEEGTWTPNLRTETGGAMTATYTGQYGTYIKIGKQVIARGVLNWSALTRTGSVMLIQGMPFLSAVGSADAGYIDQSSGIAFTSRTGGTGSVMQLSGYTVEFMAFQVSGSGQTFGDPRMDAAAFPNAGSLAFTLIYITG